MIEIGEVEIVRGRKLELYNEKLLVDRFYHGKPPFSFLLMRKETAKKFRKRGTNGRF